MKLTGNNTLSLNKRNCRNVCSPHPALFVCFNVLERVKSMTRWQHSALTEIVMWQLKIWRCLPYLHRVNKDASVQREGSAFVAQ